MDLFFWRRRKYFICTKIHNIHISVEMNLSRFVVSNIYKYVCLVYMHSSYTTVYFLIKGYIESLIKGYIERPQSMTVIVIYKHSGSGGISINRDRNQSFLDISRCV